MEDFDRKSVPIPEGMTEDEAEEFVNREEQRYKDGQEEESE